VDALKRVADRRVWTVQNVMHERRVHVRVRVQNLAQPTSAKAVLGSQDRCPSTGRELAAVHGFGLDVVDHEGVA
jgi:hypothetical protein